VLVSLNKTSKAIICRYT